MSIQKSRPNKLLTKEEKDHILDHMLLNNSEKYNISKAAEELLELSLVLVQRLNKPNKVSDQNIIDEIGDVEIRLEVLKRLFSEELVDTRINNKLNQFQRFIDTDKHKNI